MRKRHSLLSISLIGGVLLLLTMVFSVGVGSTPISPWKVICALFAPHTIDPAVVTVVTAIRLPRVLCGVLAGMGLAVSGVVMQGVFRNPLADPGLLGVSAGSGLGALLAMTGGLASFFVLPLAAFLGALAAVSVILVISVATSRNGTLSVTLVLSGMAVSAFFGAFTSLVLTAANEYQVTSYMFWTMGGLSNRRWEHVLTMLVPVLVCVAVIIVLAGRLDVLLLGEEQAGALGVHSGRNRVGFVLLASLCTAGIVCVTGPIGFVGLMIPHMMRAVVGPSHRRLCVASALMGGVFLTLCDTLVRFAAGVKGREFSVGIVTALIGAPYFLFLLVRSRKKGGF